jgi:hypothetical protein
LQNSGLDLDKALLVEPGPNGFGDGVSRQQERLAVGVPQR